MFVEKIGILLFVWVTSFLLHELMHIIGQGIKTKGKIYVDGTIGMKVTVNQAPYPKWFWYSGGILCSIIMFVVAILLTGWWQWCYLTLGWVQLIYGIYEGNYYDNVKYRYYIYLCVVLVSIIIWMVKENVYV